ncbi:hypothetical protein Bca101_044318 [Brassica carinata]
MWRKLLKLRPLAMQLTKKKINSGANTSFWYENWSALGPLIELIGERGSMDLGIPKNATVEHAVQSYRTRGHRVYSLRLIGQEILALKNRGLNQLEDECLWMRENGEFKPDFLTSQIWNLTRSKDPKVTWFKGVSSRRYPKVLFYSLVGAQSRLMTEIEFSDGILKPFPLAGYVNRKQKREIICFLTVHILRKCGKERCRIWQDWGEFISGTEYFKQL